MAKLAIPALLSLGGFVSLAAVSAPSQAGYTEAQATDGAQVYATRCAMCHGARLEGTYEIPALKDRFWGNWGHAPVAKFSDYVQRAMPQMAPGTLSPEDNAKVVAFILKQNGAALGSATIEPKK